MQPTATRCNTLQHTATHYNSLQYTATHCNTPHSSQSSVNACVCAFLHCNILQHTATYCPTLQHTATHCTALIAMYRECMRVCVSTLQHISTHCNILSHASTHCNTQHLPQSSVNACVCVPALCLTICLLGFVCSMCLCIRMYIYMCV